MTTEKEETEDQSNQEDIKTLKTTFERFNNQRINQDLMIQKTFSYSVTDRQSVSRGRTGN
jgi:hypothetical protein